MTPESACDCRDDRPPVPAPTDNPPNQDAVRRRVGTHGSFLAGLTAGLAGEPGLARLTARDPSDPAVAVLDAWAVVADVLTFYQERFANEAYLRTATERRSVAELARLVGYRLREGVSASVPLAFTIDPADPAARTVIPAGTPAQSLPRPGEQPQTFETGDPLPARTEWNLLPVRQTRPQVLKRAELEKGEQAIYLKGTATGLRPGDPLLIDFPAEPSLFARAAAVEPDPVADRTRVLLHRSPPRKAVTVLDEPALLKRLFDTRADQARNIRIGRTAADAPLGEVLNQDRELLRRTVSLTRPDVREAFHQALRNQPAAAGRFKVSALRLTARPFGHGAITPMRFVRVPNTEPPEFRAEPVPWTYARTDLDPDQFHVLWLDPPTAAVQPGDTVVVEVAGAPAEVHVVKAVAEDDREGYNLAARTTRLTLGDRWGRTVLPTADAKHLPRLKRTTVHAGPEELPLADEPLPDGEPVEGDFLELQRYMPDLEAGRLLVVEGERADLGDVQGVRAAEVARIKVVQQVEPGQWIDPATGGKVPAGDREPSGPARYTVVQLEARLAYSYRRATVRVHGNVAWATHGETRDEVLGNGDASRPWQPFALRQGPVTRLPAPTPAGSASTLEVRVDRVRWREAPRLREAGPGDRVYTTTTDDAGRTTVTFGDGRFGARPPTGSENVRARFRVGSGTPGNVQSGQVILLTQPPPGAQGVTNPLAADGGADPEGTDRARRNAPLGTLTLGRVVSVRDYAAFARTFAGIGKAEAVLLTAGHRFIQVTVAGSDDLPLPPDSDLRANLTRALARNGTARLPFRVDPRERVFVFLGAGVRLDPDYLWEDVRPELRRALVREFPFEHRGLGRHLYLSEVVAVLQRVPGVDAVEVDYFFGVEEFVTRPRDPRAPAGALARVPRNPAELEAAVRAELGRPAADRARGKVAVLPAGVDRGVVRPAQIAYFGPETLDDLKAAVSFRLVRT